eukprot:m.91133 g.91133  ORF g.91133 m.91133 type:complete len:150 (+) comp11912_c0_seq1:417-866(+)
MATGSLPNWTASWTATNGGTVMEQSLGCRGWCLGRRQSSIRVLCADSHNDPDTSDAPNQRNNNTALGGFASHAACAAMPNFLMFHGQLGELGQSLHRQGFGLPFDDLEKENAHLKGQRKLAEEHRRMEHRVCCDLEALCETWSRNFRCS